MNQKVLASFIFFVLLLATWIALALIAKPELSGLLDFVKSATLTAWTASALFFEHSPSDSTAGTAGVADTKVVAGPQSPGNSQ